MPAPMITTAALAWSLFPIGTSGQGLSPAMMYECVLGYSMDVSAFQTCIQEDLDKKTQGAWLNMYLVPLRK